MATIVLSNVGFRVCPLTLCEKYFWNRSGGRSYQGTFFDQYFPQVSDFVDRYAIEILLGITAIQLVSWVLRKRRRGTTVVRE